MENNTTVPASYPTFPKNWQIAEHPSAPFRVLLTAERWFSDGSGGRFEVADLPSGDKKDGDIARFLVRACNAHEELLEACKVMVGWIERLPAKVKEKHFPQFADPETAGTHWIYSAIAQAEA